MNFLQIKQNDKMYYDELSENSKMADRIWKEILIINMLTFHLMLKSINKMLQFLYN